jgi:hypothetical protein
MVGLGMDNNVAGQHPWWALARLAVAGMRQTRPARPGHGKADSLQSRHQIMTRCATGKYILSPSLTPNAL